MQENKLTPLAQPDLEVTKLEDGDLIEFTAEVDVRPDFELPDFSTLEATVDALDVPESLVDDQLDVLRNRFGSRETVERPAADGDVVTINLVASQGRRAAAGRDRRGPGLHRRLRRRCWRGWTRRSPACRPASPRPSPRPWSAVRSRTRRPTSRSR